MPIIAKDDGKTFELPQAGTCQAVCCAVFDLGNQQTQWKVQHKIIVMWELDQRMKQEGEYKDKRFMISKRYTLSLNEKSTLRKDIESWRGKTLTEQEIKKGFDLEKLIDVNCLLAIKIDESEGKQYANITSISPIMASMQKMQPEVKYEEVPEWIQKIRAKSVDPIHEDVPFEPDITPEEMTDDPFFKE